MQIRPKGCALRMTIDYATMKQTCDPPDRQGNVRRKIVVQRDDKAHTDSQRDMQRARLATQ